MTMRCWRCNGWLVADREDGDITCINCGARPRVAWEQEQRTKAGKSRRREPTFHGQQI